ncbi:MAG: hypothetical protein Q8P11_02380 [bacterium]|nr:hypothetical protein [bacterium]
MKEKSASAQNQLFDMADDVRNSLQVILGRLELILLVSADPKVKKIAEIAKQSAIDLALRVKQKIESL